MTNEILNRKEAAAFLKLPLSTLNYYIATGQLPFSRIGKRRVLFMKQRLIEYLQEREGIEYHMKSG